jgi:hypothetical protein
MKIMGHRISKKIHEFLRIRNDTITPMITEGSSIMHLTHPTQLDTTDYEWAAQKMVWK